MTTTRISAHITAPNLAGLDSGLYPGSGRSQRLNGVLERYFHIVNAAAANLTSQYSEQEQAQLLDAYLADGSAGPWLRSWASTHAEPYADADRWDELPLLLRRILSHSDADLAILEEVLARQMEKAAIPAVDRPPTPAEVLAARMQAGLTQAEAAALLSVRYQQWQRYERGQAQIPVEDWMLFLREAQDAAARASRPNGQTSPRRR